MPRAPFSKILPSFGPILIERGAPGYASEKLIPGERRLTTTEVTPVIIGAAFIGAEAYAIDQGFDSVRFVPVLTQSVRSIPSLTSVEQDRSLELVRAFETYRIIRAEHAFEDYICETWWELYQMVPYSYPSAMSGIILYALSIIESLKKCSLEYDQE